VPSMRSKAPREPMIGTIDARQRWINPCTVKVGQAGPGGSGGRSPAGVLGCATARSRPPGERQWPTAMSRMVGYSMRSGLLGPKMSKPSRTLAIGIRQWTAVASSNRPRLALPAISGMWSMPGPSVMRKAASSSLDWSATCTTYRLGAGRAPCRQQGTAHNQGGLGVQCCNRARYWLGIVPCGRRPDEPVRRKSRVVGQGARIDEAQVHGSAAAGAECSARARRACPIASTVRRFMVFAAPISLENGGKA
jgi:hypothetical protein